MSFRVVHRGSFTKTQSFLADASKYLRKHDLNKFGELGVQALSDATPKDTGLTANSWDYRIIDYGTGARIEWYNTNNVVSALTGDNYNVAVMLQYGHGTKNGGYVAGQDYINPAMRPVFEQIIAKIEKELKKA